MLFWLHNSTEPSATDWRDWRKHTAFRCKTFPMWVDTTRLRNKSAMETTLSLLGKLMKWKPGRAIARCFSFLLGRDVTRIQLEVTFERGREALPPGVGFPAGRHVGIKKKKGLSEFQTHGLRKQSCLRARPSLSPPLRLRAGQSVGAGQLAGWVGMHICVCVGIWVHVCVCVALFVCVWSSEVRGQAMVHREPRCSPPNRKGGHCPYVVFTHSLTHTHTHTHFRTTRIHWSKIPASTHTHLDY